jgi:hypothetical protein
MDGEVIAQNGHITYDGRRKLDSSPGGYSRNADRGPDPRARGTAGLSITPPGRPLDDRAALRGTISIPRRWRSTARRSCRTAQVTPEAQAELDKLPAFLRDKVLSGHQGEIRSSGSRRASAESFDTIKGRIGAQEVGLTASSGWGLQFLHSLSPGPITSWGFLLWGSGGVFSGCLYSPPLSWKDFGELGPIGLGLSDLRQSSRSWG